MMPPFISSASQHTTC